MPSRRKPARGPTRGEDRSGQIRHRRQSRTHLLIIECDSRKLAADGLNLGTAFGLLAKTLFPKKRIAIVQTFSEQKLNEDLGEVFKKLGRIRSVLIVGHSNEAGLVLTAEGLRSWGVVGNCFQKFEPEFCFLAACRAGKSEAVRDLFKTIKTLRQVYASPAALYRDQSSALAVLIGMLLMDGKIDDEQSAALRLSNYAQTGGQLYRWRRAETGPGEEITARMVDAVGSFLDRGAWDLAETLFPNTRVLG